MNGLLSWFSRENGTLDTASMSLTDIPGQGKGAIALRDISEGHTLFTIPRSLTLSTRTSSLPNLVGNVAWKRLGLDKGWIGLILCMMWEESLGEKSRWSGYLETLPKKFDTPMFWSADDLKELYGTAVIDKIGKDEAERDYHEKLVPALQSRPDLFDLSHVSSFYSLENYHLMGSRILSRSFQVEKWEGDAGDDENHEENQAVQEDTMDIDGEVAEHQADNDAKDDDDDDDDEADPSDVAMVPMADMLNARYNSENAKLFYEPTELRMVTTKAIKAGEQIYNTYGDLPNTDLLRRYGHVDVVPLSSENGGGDSSRNIISEQGNPADVVEVPADLAVEVIAKHLHRSDDDGTLKERIDWWLEEGGDDVFILETNLSVPDSLVSFFKLLMSSSTEWEKMRDKGKPPKPKMDVDVLMLVLALLVKRLEKYPTTLEHDEALLASSTGSQALSNNRRSALIVRVGEKRILKGSIEKLEALQRELTDGEKSATKAKGSVTAQRKRKGDENVQAGKRSKR
ncbi:SET domain-containing protein [Phellopilus nigrolimitatus]|nr:SET domain-containing protein [Phellopilus nigrolimitatus]